MICRYTTGLLLVQIIIYGLCDTQVVVDTLWHMIVGCKVNDMSVNVYQCL